MRPALLELAKGLAFFAGLFSLYPVVASAFLTPELRWRERLAVTVPRLILAAAVALGAGMVFRWPARHNPDAGAALSATLPVRLFVFALPLLAALFALAWYFGCAAPLSEVVPYACR